MVVTIQPEEAAIIALELVKKCVLQEHIAPMEWHLHARRASLGMYRVSLCQSVVDGVPKVITAQQGQPFPSFAPQITTQKVPLGFVVNVQVLEIHPSLAMINDLAVLWAEWSITLYCPCVIFFGFLI